MAFLGLDLTCSAAKPTAAVGLDGGLGLAFWELLHGDSDIIGTVASLKPQLVAIDAPLAMPPGMCCLEEACPCASSQRFRSAELELRRLGIGCYYTTKKSIIKGMVYRGIKLKTQLDALGYPALEVYPYATKLRLWGRVIPRKTTPQGLAWLREKLAELLPSLVYSLPRLNHDLADAALAAYTAYLHSLGQAEMVGSPEDGQICIPRL